MMPTPRSGSFSRSAPEVLQNQPRTPASDVYAFAMIAFELFTNEPPFASQLKRMVRFRATDTLRTITLWKGASRPRAYGSMLPYCSTLIVCDARRF